MGRETCALGDAGLLGGRLALPSLLRLEALVARCSGSPVPFRAIEMHAWHAKVPMTLFLVAYIYAYKAHTINDVHTTVCV